MATQIIVDSASDILPQEAVEMGVTVLPLKVLFGTEEFADSVDLTHREFYEKLIESDVLPTTCQIPPSDFETAYQQVIANGDCAMVITVSGQLSGTYQSAMIAAENYPGKIYVVDSAELWQVHAALLPVTTVGCTIGTHVGPGAIAVAFFENY